VSLEKFIFSLGIRHIGQENAKLIAENLKDIKNLLKIDAKYNFQTFLNIDGIGETQAKSLKNFFSNEINVNIIKKLTQQLTISKIENKKTGKFIDKTFLITGKLNGISRAEAKSKIEKQSGKMLSSVNKNLNYLITGDKPTVKKINKAKELNIVILDQKEFFNLLD